jgi:FRG domain.
MTTRPASAVRVLKFGDWTEFTRDAFVELFGDGIFRHGRYLFRGAADADYDLRSHFDRRFATVPTERRMALWERLGQEWRRGCEQAGVDPALLAEDRTLWALGQHYGLPTRLLDWSTSPYVAAFFAFADHLPVRRSGSRTWRSGPCTWTTRCGRAPTVSRW